MNYKHVKYDSEKATFGTWLLRLVFVSAVVAFGAFLTIVANRSTSMLSEREQNSPDFTPKNSFSLTPEVSSISQQIEDIRKFNVDFQVEPIPVRTIAVENKIDRLLEIDRSSLDRNDQVRFDSTCVELYSMHDFLSTIAGDTPSRYLPQLESYASSNQVDVVPQIRRQALERLLDVPLSQFEQTRTDKSKSKVIDRLNAMGLTAIENRKDRDRVFKFLRNGLALAEGNDDYQEIAETVTIIARGGEGDVSESFANDIETLIAFSDFKPSFERHALTAAGNLGIKNARGWLDKIESLPSTGTRLPMEIAFLIELMSLEHSDDGSELMLRLKTSVLRSANAFERVELNQFFAGQKKRESLIGSKIDLPMLDEANSIGAPKNRNVVIFMDFLDESQLIRVLPLIQEASVESANFDLVVINIGNHSDAVQGLIARCSESPAIMHSSNELLPVVKEYSLATVPDVYMLVLDGSHKVVSVAVDTFNVMRELDAARIEQASASQ